MNFVVLEKLRSNFSNTTKYQERTSGMKRIAVLLISVWCGLLLSGCDGASAPPPGDVTAVAAPIATRAAGAEAILVPPTLSANRSSAQAAAPGGGLTLSNHASWDVCYVYITKPEADTWGDDWLASDEQVEAGGSWSFEVPAGVYDLRAESCDYISMNETYRVNLDQPYTWDVGDPAMDVSIGFDEPSSLKVKGSTAAGEVRSGAYYLENHQRGGLAYSLAGVNLSDSVATVEAMPTAPADVRLVGFGLMCRVQANGDGYLFMARGDGSYAIEKVSGGKISALVDWKLTHQLNPGASLNVVEAKCNHDELSIRLNGYTVEKVSDTSFQQGDVALALLPLSNGDAEVQFDNWVVTKP
jgi:hypothetical protein